MINELGCGCSGGGKGLELEFLDMTLGRVLLLFETVTHMGQKTSSEEAHAKIQSISLCNYNLTTTKRGYLKPSHP